MKKEDPSAPVFHEDRPSVYHSIPENPQDGGYYQPYPDSQNTNSSNPYLVSANYQLPQHGYHSGHIPLDEVPEHSQFHEPMACRLCFEPDSDNTTGPLIAPCDCKGTMKYIHRNCLDRWRTLSPKARSFYKCDQCMRSYDFINSSRKPSPMRYLKYAFHVSLDIVIYLILWQLAVLICTVGYAIIDILLLKGSSTKWANPFPGGFLYIAYGHGVFFFVLGIVAIVVCSLYLCFSATCTNRRAPVYFGGYNPFISDWLFWWFIFSHPTYHPIFPVAPAPCMDCTNCIRVDCGGCGNCNIDSGNDGIGILIAILIAIVVIIIIIGAIFGFLITMFILLGICQRHYTILKKKDEVNYYIVKDLENQSNNQVFVTKQVV